MQSQMAARAGAELAGYRIQSVLGRGGMGVVYLATDTALDRRVALKVIAPALAADRSYRERFEREARAAASLDHPHVTPVYAAGEHEGTLYIAMRYVDGADLRSLLGAGQLQPARAARLATQVAAALGAAHARGLVHRDVKPANVLVARDGETEHAYLTDFGLAKRSSAARELTAAGQLLGTLDYVAPEQVRGDPVDARADLYALGCVLFEMLTGTIPFPRDNDLAKLWAHVSDPPPALSELEPAVPAALAEVVERAMSKRADDRFADAGEMAAALEAALGERPTAVAVSARSARRRRSQLPPILSRTVGREADREAVAELLGMCRLVTLTGPGGVGKTRLALEVAGGFEEDLVDGTWFVALAALARAEDVGSAIAQAVGATPLHGESPEAAVERFLEARRGLLVLDNLEHLLDAAPGIAALLARCPDVTALVTSREPLRLTGERLFPVEPLEPSAARELFEEQAGGHDADPAAVEEICRRLDGLPLAIELAAARARALGAGEVRARLGNALDSLGTGPRDAPARQHTLRATIDWSHELLEPDEAGAFARFAVFAGGATIEAAMAVTGAGLDVLAALVEKQLLRRRPAAGGARLVMLETVRQYAAERLPVDEATEARRRHLRCFAELVARLEPDLYTRGEPEALARLDAEAENVRRAVAFALEDDPCASLRLAGLLGRFWLIRGWLDEGLRWLRDARDAAGDLAPPRDRALAMRAELRLLDSLGSAYDRGELRARAVALGEETLALARESGDAIAIAEALLALCDLEVAERLPHRRRREMAAEALSAARRSGDQRLVGQALMQSALSLPAMHAGAEIAEAERELLAIGSARTLLGLYNSAAYNAIKQDLPRVAVPLLERAEPIVEQLGDPRADIFLSGNAGLAALFSGDRRRARVAFARQVETGRTERAFELLGEGLAGLAALAVAGGHVERAGRVLGAGAAAGPIGDADIVELLDRDFFDTARAACGPRRWDELQDEGARLDLADAIELALSVPES